MKKKTWAAIAAGTLFLCATAYAAGSYAKEKLIEEAVQEAQRQQGAARQQEPQAGYILIHTTDGETWGFYGDMKIISDGTDGRDIDIDMSGWLVGSTHDCYNPDPEE